MKATTAGFATRLDGPESCDGSKLHGTGHSHSLNTLPMVQVERLLAAGPP